MTLLEDSYQKESGYADSTGQQISDVETCGNSLPRELLGYRIPDEIFEEEIDLIYHGAALQKVFNLLLQFVICIIIVK